MPNSHLHRRTGQANIAFDSPLQKQAAQVRAQRDLMKRFAVEYRGLADTVPSCRERHLDFMFECLQAKIEIERNVLPRIEQAIGEQRRAVYEQKLHDMLAGKTAE